jgi:nucleotide-binding universal stress UspA family protein
MLPLKRILWPTDFSAASYKSLEAAKELAARFSSELWAMHVLQPFSAFRAELTVSLPAYEHELLAGCRASLEKVLQERAGNEFQIHKILKIGRPAEEIVRFAAEEKMDLVVIATHGESVFHHFIFGSVAEKVIRIAPCPVLVLRVSQ